MLSMDLPDGGRSERNPMPLDAARVAFERLVRRPHPVSVDGRLFSGLPTRRVPLDELRERLLARCCPQATRDAVWAHLVLRARLEGAVWAAGCVGVGLPALTRVATTLSARFAGDVSDIHAAVLAGFLGELGHIDLRKPRIMLRLRWAAYRAGHAALREALDAPLPSGTGFGSAPPTPPWGHPDLVLARAVAENVITAGEAELIGATRLEGLPLANAAVERGTSYKATHQARRRAEQRLVAYLRGGSAVEEAADSPDRDVATQALDAATITAAGRAAAAAAGTASPVHPGAAGRRSTRSQSRVSKTGPNSGVQRRGRTPPTQHSSPAHPSAQTPEEPRCA